MLKYFIFILVLICSSGPPLVSEVYWPVSSIIHFRFEPRNNHLHPWSLHQHWWIQTSGSLAWTSVWYWNLCSLIQSLVWTLLCQECWKVFYRWNSLVTKILLLACDQQSASASHDCCSRHWWLFLIWILWTECLQVSTNWSGDTQEPGDAWSLIRKQNCLVIVFESFLLSFTDSAK